MGQPPGPGRGSCRRGRGAWDPGRCGPQRQPGRAGSQAAAQFLVPVTLAWTAQWCWRQGFPELSPLPLPRHIPPSGWGLPQKWVLGEVDVLFPWCTRTRLRCTEHAPSGGARRRERSGGGSATPLGPGVHRRHAVASSHCSLGTPQPPAPATALPPRGLAQKPPFPQPGPGAAASRRPPCVSWLGSARLTPTASHPWWSS